MRRCGAEVLLRENGNSDWASPSASGCLHKHQGDSKDLLERPGAKEMAGAELAAAQG